MRGVFAFASIAALAALGFSAIAQAPLRPVDDAEIDELILTLIGKDLALLRRASDPAAQASLKAYTDFAARSLYSAYPTVKAMLDRDGRCRGVAKAPRGFEGGRPCAVLVLKPTTDGPDVQRVVFRPIYRMLTNGQVDTVFQGEFAYVRSETLAAASFADISGDMARQTRYVLIGVIGREENRAECNKPQPNVCLVSPDLFARRQD